VYQDALLKPDWMSVSHLLRVLFAMLPKASPLIHPLLLVPVQRVIT
jgi:hypothetical protein